MLTPLPKLNSRQASDLHRELEAITSVLLPEWRGKEFEGDFGQALLLILSRLGEHVTTRIEQTPWRDALAFFNMLEIPAQAAQPSLVPLVFQLAEKRMTSVFAPSGIQVGASTEEGQLLFETTGTVNLTPARLEFLASVDGENDRIELAQPGFLELAPPEGPLPMFQAVSFSAKGSKLIQIEPFEELEKGDYIRIASSVYRLDEGQDGLFPLLDQLEDDVEPGTAIEKVEQFNVFKHRNLQEHALYIGHSELFNISQSNTISLDIEPASVASELARDTVQWELYGKVVNQENADWQAVEVQLGLTGELLIKTVALEGTEETNVNEIKSRWLRAQYTAESSAIERIIDITIGINSEPEPEPEPEPEVFLMSVVLDDSIVTNTITQAFHNNHPISLSAAFQPFGPEPLRFDTFSIAASEAFSKKGAKVTLNISVEGAVIENEPKLAWEYFDGEGWRSLELEDDPNVDPNVDPRHFLGSGDIVFTVPDDLAMGEVAGQEDYWIRTRLAGGDFGRPTYPLEFVDGQFVIGIDIDSVLPPEITSIEATFESVESTQVEHLLVKNNLDFRNYTQASQVENANFELLEDANKLNGYLSLDQQETRLSQKALYFGFNKPFDISPLSIFIDAEEQDKKIDISFEILGRDDWKKVNAIDETNGFHRRGFLQIFVDREPRLARLFGRESYWLRARSHSSSIDWSPSLVGVYINAVSAKQAKTIEQEILGSSAGEPDLRVGLSKLPVIQDSLELRIKENLSDEEKDNLLIDAQNQQQHGRFIQPIRTFEKLSLEGEWVLWQRVDSFLGKKPDDRIYLLDHASGEIKFGNSRQGRIPTAGSNNIRAIRYQTGGGIKSNVAAYTITGLKSGVEGVESVTNPIQAAGGTDAPTIEEQVTGAPARLRSFDQALSPPDIEALLVSTSPNLIRARCAFPKAPGDPIHVAVLMRNGNRCPQPTLAERDALAELILNHSWGGLKDGDIKVTGPEYVSVQLKLQLRATSNEKIAELERVATDRISLLLHPIDGGPSGEGWQFGRRLWELDILRALAELPSFDSVVEFHPGLDDLDSPSTLGMVCSEQGGIEVIVKPTEEVF